MKYDNQKVYNERRTKAYRTQIVMAIRLGYMTNPTDWDGLERYQADVKDGRLIERIKQG
ncbi:MAG: hypothetical protein GY938_16775 [Ketobacter sp.]|nr:hypothetical protein [Ketobacter sp.]